MKKTIGISLERKHIEIIDGGPASRAKNVRAMIEYFHKNFAWDGVDAFGNVKIKAKKGKDGVK